MPEISSLLRQRLQAGENTRLQHPDADTLTAYVEQLLPAPERKLVLERRSGGARLVRDLALASRRSRRARPRWRWPIRMGRNGKRRQAAE